MGTDVLGTHSRSEPLKDGLWLVKQRPCVGHRGYPPVPHDMMMLKAHCTLPKREEASRALEKGRRKVPRKEVPQTFDLWP